MQNYVDVGLFTKMNIIMHLYIIPLELESDNLTPSNSKETIYRHNIIE